MNKREIEKIKRMKKEAWDNRQRYTGFKPDNMRQFAYHAGEFEAYRLVLKIGKKK